MSSLTHDEAVALTLVAIDYGERRIGVALKLAGQTLILPRQVLIVASEQEAVESVRKILGETAAQGVVVGLPIHDDPEQARRVKRFCRRTREGQTGVRWFFEDESLTSQEAASISLEKAPRRPQDDLAAALILESFLNSRPRP